MSVERIRVPPQSRKVNSENNLGDFRSLKTKTESEIADEGQDDLLIDQLAKRIELNNNYLHVFKEMVKDGEYLKQKLDDKLKQQDLEEKLKQESLT